MSATRPARRLTIIVDEDATYHHKPLYAEIVHRAHRTGLAGASVFRGLEGFGASHRVHTSRLLNFAERLPAMIILVDTAEKIDGFLLQLADLDVRGVVTVDEVELVQLNRPDPAAGS